jgi:hypothetical protein
VSSPSPARRPLPPTRRARALTAWLTRAQIERLDTPAPTVESRRIARDALAARPPEPAQDDLIGQWPAVLEGHAGALRASPTAKRMFDDGWRLALITDLGRVIAAQSTVVVDDTSAAGLPAEGAPPTLEELARLTLPVSARSAEVATNFDENEQRWIVTSPDPNLRITGTFSGEVQTNVLGVGFFFEVLNSFVSVAEVRGRYVLRDGYHRCYRLLGAGVTAVPVFVRTFREDEPVFNGPMLDPEVWCGPTPPTLLDFHDDRVSAEIRIGVDHTTAIVAAGPRRLAVGTSAPAAPPT